MGLKIIDQTKGIWNKTSYSTLLYLLLVVILACLISSYLLGAVFCKLVFGISFFSSSQQVFDPSNQNLIEAMKAMQLFNAIGTFVLPPFLFLHLRGLPAFGSLKLNVQLTRWSILKLFFTALAMVPIANFLGSLNEDLPLPEFLSFLKLAEEQSMQLTEQFLIMDSVLDLAYIILIMGVVAALGEELLFRGLLQNLFKNWSNSFHFSVWITAFLFSVIHMQYHAVIPRFFLGAFIGYLFVYSGGLRSSIYVHFFYNTILILLSYFIQHNLVPAYLESFGENDWSVFIVALLVLFGISYSLVKPIAQK